MLKRFMLLLIAIIFIGGCKLADPRPLCEDHVQPDKHSYEAHATCVDDDHDDDGDDDHEDEEEEDDGHGGH